MNIKCSVQISIPNMDESSGYSIFTFPETREVYDSRVVAAFAQWFAESVAGAQSLVMYNRDNGTYSIFGPEDIKSMYVAVREHGYTGFFDMPHHSEEVDEFLDEDGQSKEQEEADIIEGLAGIWKEYRCTAIHSDESTLEIEGEP